jgi:hypothetical protein
MVFRGLLTTFVTFVLLFDWRATPRCGFGSGNCRHSLTEAYTGRVMSGTRSNTHRAGGEPIVFVLIRVERASLDGNPRDNGVCSKCS